MRGLWVVGLLGLLCVLGVGHSRSQSDLGNAFRDGKVITGVTPHRIIHFTFDDGPDPRTTPRLLDRLDAHGIKATFFFSASRFESRAKRHQGADVLAQEVLARGHAVGSHSVDHVRMRALSAAQVRDQLERNERLFTQVFGTKSVWFRPPFGSRGAHTDQQLAERGHTTVMWNLGVADWVARPPQAILITWQRVLAKAELRGERGGVVLLHDTHAWTADALDLIMADLATRNCELLKDPSAELYDVTPTLAPFFQARGDAPIATDTTPITLAPDVLARRQQELRSLWRERCTR